MSVKSTSHRISVIMPAYNGEQYLQEAIQSILDQTEKNFEFVIINDGSTDNTWKMLKNNSDTRIRLFQNEKNIGLAGSLNKGLALARGMYITRMDADDIALPKRFEKQIAYLECHPEVGVLGSQMMITDAKGKVTGTYRVPQTHGAILWRLFFGNPMAHPTVMFRRTVLRENEGYDTTLGASQDKELWARLIHRTQFANLNENLLKYRKHQHSVWANHADVAHNVSLAVGRKLASEYLEENISVATWSLVDRSQHTQAILNPAEMEQAGAIIHRLYNAVISRENLPQRDLDEIHADMIRRMLAVGKRDGRIAVGNVARTYWQDILPEPIWNLARAVVRPKRAFSILIKNDKTLKPETQEALKPSNKVEQSKDQTSPAYGEKSEGLSIVIVSFERLGALKILLKNLAKQELEGIDTELIIISNSPKVKITTSRFSALGRLLYKFHEPKVLNSSYNWGPGIRYAIATAAKYRTILFFDDDIYPINPSFIAKMYHTFKALRPTDILTCWADLWVEWTDDYLSTVSMGFKTPEITELTECDYCGTGISMFNKKILMHPDMLDIPLEYRFADTAWFPWIPSIVHGTRKYYFPSFGMLRFHKEQRRASLSRRDGYEKFIFSARRAMLERGYRPVLGKIEQRCWLNDSPEQVAARKLQVVTRSW